MTTTPKNHGKPWTKGDLRALVVGFAQDIRVQTLAEGLQRTPGAVLGKLREFRLVQTEDDYTYSRVLRFAQRVRAISPGLDLYSITIHPGEFSENRWCQDGRVKSDASPKLKQSQEASMPEQILGPPRVSNEAANKLDNFVLEWINDADFYKAVLPEVKRLAALWANRDTQDYDGLRAFLRRTYVGRRANDSREITYVVEQLWRHYFEEAYGRLMTTADVQQLRRLSCRPTHYLNAPQEAEAPECNIQTETTAGTPAKPELKEISMSALNNNTAAPAVETKTFIFGIEASQVSDETIWQTVAKIEGELSSLKAIKNQSLALKARINTLEGNIRELIALSDARQPADAGAKAAKPAKKPVAKKVETPADPQ